MIEEINKELNELLDRMVASEDEYALKIAQHIQEINELHETGKIDLNTRNELFEDINQIVEVEKEAAALEAKIMLEQASTILKMLVKLV